MTREGAMPMLRMCPRLAASIGLLAASVPASPQSTTSPPPAYRTKVVLLGTGSPPADPDRSGPSTAVVVNGVPYLVDFGAGVVRRAKAAVADRGIDALEPAKLRVAFVTHLHSDHTVGFPDLILTPWVLERRLHRCLLPRRDHAGSHSGAAVHHPTGVLRIAISTLIRDQDAHDIGCALAASGRQRSRDPLLVTHVSLSGSCGRSLS